MYRKLYPLLFLLLLTACFFNPQYEKNIANSAVSEDGFFPATNNLIKYYGRVDFSDSLSAKFSFPGINIRFRFKGTQLAIHMRDLTLAGIQADGKPAQNFFNVYIDDNDPFVLALNRTDSIYVLAENLRDTRHTVKLIKRTEGMAGKVKFIGIEANPGAQLIALNERTALKIEFIGNSISCGYGVEAESAIEPFSCTTENVCKSYTVLTADKLKAEYSIVAFSGRGISQNFDRSRKNTLSMIWRQIFPDEDQPAWDHRRYIPDVVVMNLGTNDFFSGTIVPSYFRYKYTEFVMELRATYPESKIVCLVGPMLNNSYPENGLNMARIIISSIVRNFNKGGDNEIYYLELSPQTGEYGFGADWHPSADQQKYNAKELIRFLTPIIYSR